MAAAALPIGMALSSILAGIFSNRKTTQEQRSNSSEAFDKTTNTGVDMYDMPEYSEQMQGVLNNLLSVLGNRMNTSTDLSGYTNQGMLNINKGAELKRKAMENVLAARGLSFSPAATAPLGRIQSDRIGEQVNFLSSIPLLQRQLQGEDVDRFSNFFSKLPVGQHRTGVTNVYETGHGNKESYGTSTDPGNMFGGGLAGLASSLAMIYGQQGPGGGTKKTPNIPWP